MRPLAFALRCCVLALLVAVSASASSLTVPIDVPTVQEAIDSGVDSVLIQPGVYHEAPVVSLQIYLGAATQDLIAPLPRLNGLTIFRPYREPGGVPTFVFERLQFDGEVIINNSAGACIVRMLHCALMQGTRDVSRYVETSEIDLIGCSAAAPVEVTVDGACIADSCDFGAGLRAWTNQGFMSVTHCRITGSSSSVGVGGDNMGSAIVEDCEVSDVSQGIILFYTENHSAVRRNTITGCLSPIIAWTGGGTVVVDSNRVIGGGGPYSPGISVTADRCEIVGNAVQDCADVGIYADASTECRILNNVAFGNRSHGIWISANGNGVQVTLEGNTSALNHGSGLVAEFRNPDPGTTVARNIGYGNDGFGLLWGEAVFANVSCNDWFENHAGAVGGATPSPMDWAMDPWFCDVSVDDFHLQAASPLADAPNCGVIGALGIGCATTATLVSLFSVEPVPMGVRIRWELSAQTDFQSVWVERMGDDSGAWSRVAAEVGSQGRTSVVFDTGASPNGVFDYRLMGLRNGESIVLAGPVRVETTSLARFAIMGVTPNPGTDRVEIGFVLPRSAPIQLNVLDVQGRLVSKLAHGSMTAGAYTVGWDSLEPGVYMLDYRFPGGHEVRRLVMLR